MQMRHDLNLLMRTVRKEPDEQQIDTTVTWEELYSSDDEGVSEYRDVLKQAEVVQKRIVDGNGLETSDVDLADLSARLSEISDFVSDELREFQRNIIQKALRATVSAASAKPPRCAGIVSQTAGSGISHSLISYVQGVLSLPTLNNPIILIAADRNDLRAQIYQHFSRTARHASELSVQISDNPSLVSLLRLNEKKVVFTTTQRILSLRDKGPFLGENIVFVGFDVHGTPRVTEIFPNAIFILFTSSFLPTPETSAIFGELIAHYSLKQAIDDKVSAAVDYVARKIHPEISQTDLEEHVGTGFDSSFRSIENAHRVAADIISHFESQNLDKDSKAVIVTLRVQTQSIMFSAIQSLRPEWTNEDLIPPISGAVDRHSLESALSRVRDPRDPFKLAMISSGVLRGIDIFGIKTAYIVEHLPQLALARAVALVSRGVDKGHGLIVDYGHNLDGVNALLSD